MKRKQFGENLKSARKRAGLTQKQLGEMAGTGQVVIANYERGARFPGEEALCRLAEVLNVSLDSLFSLSPEKDLKKRDISEIDLNNLLILLKNDPVGVVWEKIRNWKESHSLGVEEVYNRVLIPLLRKTGELWFSGVYSVWEEHLLSSKIRELITLTASGEEMWNRCPVGGKSWMGLCAPGEKHDLVLFMTSQLLLLKGWDVRFIGQDLPVNDLIEAINEFRPDVLCFSLTAVSFREGLETYIRVINNKSDFDFNIILGGPALLPEDRDRFPGVTAIAENLSRGVALAEACVNKRRPLC